MQSQSFDYLLYVLFKVFTHGKADKLGKYSCPTVFTLILYICTVDASIQFATDYFAAVQVSVETDFFSFYT